MTDNTISRTYKDIAHCLQIRTDHDCAGKSQNYIKHYKNELRLWDVILRDPLYHSLMDEEESDAKEDAFDAAMDCIYRAGGV